MIIGAFEVLLRIYFIIIYLEQMKQLIIKKIRLWFRQNPLYITNSNIDNYPDEFLNISENRRDYKYKEYLNDDVKQWIYKKSPSRF